MTPVSSAQLKAVAPEAIHHRRAAGDRLWLPSDCSSFPPGEGDPVAWDMLNLFFPSRRRPASVTTG
ncbi:hypothetical protein GCM10009548_23580 [Streptomyces malaysiensis subsp. malaysiensis]